MFLKTINNINFDDFKIKIKCVNHNFKESILKDTTIVGIDPGTNTGVCVINSTQMQYFTCKFWHCIALINKCLYSQCVTTFNVENASLINTTYTKRNVESMTNRSAARLGRNIGSANEQASLIVEYLKILKVNYNEIVPSKSKRDHDMIQKITSLKIPKTNQHERDAISIAYTAYKNMLFVNKVLK